MILLVVLLLGSQLSPGRVMGHEASGAMSIDLDGLLGAVFWNPSKKITEIDKYLEINIKVWTGGFLRCFQGLFPLIGSSGALRSSWQGFFQLTVSRKGFFRL